MSADQQQQSGSAETNGVKQPEPQTSTVSTISNGDNYVKFTEFLHLNFSHSKQFSGLPTSNTAAINGPTSFDPFAALRQLLPSFPSAPNWNSWAQVQTASGRVGAGNIQPEQQQGQFPNIVPMGQTNVVNKPRNNGFNSNYNYNFGKNDVDKYGVDFSAHGNPATTGFPGTANLRGLKPTEKSTITDESSERQPDEKLLPKPKRPNSKSVEKSSERPSSLPQRNITAYWIF